MLTRLMQASKLLVDVATVASRPPLKTFRAATCSTLGCGSFQGLLCAARASRGCSTSSTSSSSCVPPSASAAAAAAAAPPAAALLADLDAYESSHAAAEYDSIVCSRACALLGGSAAPPGSSLGALLTRRLDRWLQRPASSRGAAGPSLFITSAAAGLGVSSIPAELALDVAGSAPALSADDAAAAIWAAGRFGISNDAIIDPLLAAAAAHAEAQRYVPEALASLLEAVALLEGGDPTGARLRRVQSLLETALAMAGSHPTVAAAVFYAAVKLESQDALMLRSVAEALVGGPAASLASAHSVAISLYALAKVHQTDAIPSATQLELTTVLYAAAGRLAAHLGNRDVAYCLWAASKMEMTRTGTLPQEVLGDLCAATVRLVDDLAAKDASMCLLALSRLGVTEPSVLEPLLGAVVRLAPTFDVQSVTNVLSALARTGFRDQAVIAPLVVSAVRLAPSFTSGEDVSRLLRALHFLGVKEGHPTSLQPLMAAAVRLADSAPHAATCLWAATKLRCSDPDVIVPLVECVVRDAEALSDKHIAWGLWALSAQGVSDDVVVGPLLRERQRRRRA